MMIKLMCCAQTPMGFSAVIQGDHGVVLLRDLVWIADRLDIVELYYTQAVAVLMGEPHCCLSRPGKLLMLA